MIYTFGDSITYGFNFDTNREQRIWPFHLAKKLNQPLINYAAPGSSNWRIARKISSMQFNKEDIVIISWTEPSRFEFGVNKDYESPKPYPDRAADIREIDGNIISRRFFNQLTNRTSDSTIKKFNAIAYKELFNTEWFEQMFKIMFSSCCYKLSLIDCKWVMFNTWCNQYTEPDEVYNIPNYFIRGHDTLADQLRDDNVIDYWDDASHILASNIILKNIEQIYGNFLGD